MEPDQPSRRTLSSQLRMLVLGPALALTGAILVLASLLMPWAQWIILPQGHIPAYSWQIGVRGLNGFYELTSTPFSVWVGILASAALVGLLARAVFVHTSRARTAAAGLLLLAGLAALCAWVPMFTAIKADLPPGAGTVGGIARGVWAALIGATLLIVSGFLMIRWREPADGRGSPNRPAALVAWFVGVAVIGMIGALALGLIRTDQMNEGAAQTSLRNALNDAKTCYVRASSYSGCGSDALGDASRPELPGFAFCARPGGLSNWMCQGVVFTDGASTDFKVVSVKVSPDGRSVELAVWAPSSGQCLSIKDDSATPTDPPYITTTYGREESSLCQAGVNATNYSEQW